MSDGILYEIAMTQLPGIGDISGKKFVQYCGSAEAVFKETRKSLEKINGMREASIDAICKPKEYLKRAEEEMAFMEKANLNANRVVAIVGTRNITEYGKENCNQLVEDLKDDNVLIVSGLAYGVDTCAHKASVKNGIPTVGVMGSGMQQIYPAPNKKLASDMVEQGGGILTECISGTLPDRENFPRRNRIIAGMADAVVVIESAMKGGSLITADLANSYSRDVFAYPGRVMDLYSQGCNYLIRTNRAHLMESVLNLRYIMRWDSESKTEKQTALFREFTPEEKLVMDCFGANAVINLDDIIVKTELPTTKIATILLTLEFDGVLMALPGKRYQKC